MGRWTCIALLGWFLLINSLVGLEGLKTRSEYEPSWQDSVRTFLSEIESVEMEYPNQTRETWNQLKSILAGMLEVTPPDTPPIVTVLLPDGVDEIFGVCFLNKISTAVNKAVVSAHGPGERSRLSMVLSPSQLHKRTIQETTAILEIFLKWHGKTIIIVDEDKIQNELQVELVHSVLKHNLAIDNRAVIFFPLKLPSHQLLKLRKDKTVSDLYSILAKKWPNFDGQLVSQISEKLSENLIFLQNGDKCENNPIKEITPTMINVVEYEVRLKNDLNGSLERHESKSIDTVRKLVSGKIATKIEEISREIIMFTGRALENEQMKHLEQEITDILFSRHFGIRHSAETESQSASEEEGGHLKLQNDMCSKIGEDLEQLKKQFNILRDEEALDEDGASEKEQKKVYKLLQENINKLAAKVDELNENIMKQEKRQDGTFTRVMEWIAVLLKSIKLAYETFTAIPGLQHFFSQLFSYILSWFS